MSNATNAVKRLFHVLFVPYRPTESVIKDSNMTEFKNKAGDTIRTQPRHLEKLGRFLVLDLPDFGSVASNKNLVELIRKSAGIEMNGVHRKNLKRFYDSAHNPVPKKYADGLMYSQYTFKDEADAAKVLGDDVEIPEQGTAWNDKTKGVYIPLSRVFDSGEMSTKALAASAKVLIASIRDNESLSLEMKIAILEDAGIDPESVLPELQTNGEDEEDEEAAESSTEAQDK